jgi:hypothetical protein
LDSGAGSLRQALLDIAGAPGLAHTIQFAVPAGPQTITLLSPLTAAVDPLTLSLDATQNVTLIPAAGAVWTNHQSLAISGAGMISMGSGIEGTGDLSISGGGSLTATHIIQDALVIGGTAGSPAIVTIAPSDSSGNPLGVSSANQRVVPASSMAAVASPSISTAVSAAGLEAIEKQPVAEPMRPSTNVMDPSNIDAALETSQAGSMAAPQTPIVDAASPTSTLNPVTAPPAAVTRLIDFNALAAVMSQLDPFEWAADNSVSRRAASDPLGVLGDDLFANIVGD